MRISILFLLFILSCKPATVEDTSKPNETDFATMNLMDTKMTLVGKAQNKALEWKAYQDLLTGLENYDHSIKVTSQLIDHVNLMLETPEESFKDQAIISRIKILKTRLSIYKSYLGYRTKTNKTSEVKYNAIITALDELTDQMNWQINEFHPDNQKLLDDLKADLDPDQV